jgi:uncharacterized membrane protein YbhN (UPF0104 family)
MSAEPGSESEEETWANGPPPEEAKRRAMRTWALRVGSTVIALGVWWALARVSVGEVADAVARIAPTALAAGTALAFGGFVVGALRWRLLLQAYGAVRVPSLGTLLRVYLVGMFFNTFLGGELVRAHVTRDAFDGAAGSYLIVAMERVFGLAGLFLLGGCVLMVRPLGELSHLRPVAVLGVLVALGAGAAPLIARKAGGRLPGRLGEAARQLPTLVSPARLLGVLGLSVCTQMLGAVTGFFFLASLTDQITLADTLVLVPVALISQYLPTVAGLGAREAAFVFLFGLVHVAEADATAASLAVMATQLATALTGGALHMLGRRAPTG